MKGPRPHPKGYPAEPKTLGQQLTKRRMDLGLTRQEAARALGVWDQALRNWEKDLIEPRVSFFPRIYAFLGVEAPRPEGRLGVRLLAYRRAHGLDRLAVGRRIGVTPDTLANVEKGSGRWITQPVRRAIERLLDC